MIKYCNLYFNTATSTECCFCQFCNVASSTLFEWHNKVKKEGEGCLIITLLQLDWLLFYPLSEAAWVTRWTNYNYISIHLNPNTPIHPYSFLSSISFPAKILVVFVKCFVAVKCLCLLWQDYKKARISSLNIHKCFPVFNSIGLKLWKCGICIL